jgi:hypothetical protein
VISPQREALARNVLLPGRRLLGVGPPSRQSVQRGHSLSDYVAAPELGSWFQVICTAGSNLPGVAAYRSRANAVNRCNNRGRSRTLGSSLNIRVARDHLQELALTHD